MSILELKTTPAIMGAIQRYIAERLYNMTQMLKMSKGQVTSAEPLLGELVVVEAKLDALLLTLEQQGMNFDNFAANLEEVCKIGQANAITIRKQYMAMGQIIK